MKSICLVTIDGLTRQAKNPDEFDHKTAEWYVSVEDYERLEKAAYRAETEAQDTPFSDLARGECKPLEGNQDGTLEGERSPIELNITFMKEPVFGVVYDGAELGPVFKLPNKTTIKFREVVTPSQPVDDREAREKWIDNIAPALQTDYHRQKHRETWDACKRFYFGGE